MCDTRETRELLHEPDRGDRVVEGLTVGQVVTLANEIALQSGRRQQVRVHRVQFIDGTTKKFTGYAEPASGDDRSGFYRWPHRKFRIQEVR